MILNLLNIQETTLKYTCTHIRWHRAERRYQNEREHFLVCSMWLCVHFFFLLLHTVQSVCIMAIRTKFNTDANNKKKKQHPFITKINRRITINKSNIGNNIDGSSYFVFRDSKTGTINSIDSAAHLMVCGGGHANRKFMW